MESMEKAEILKVVSAWLDSASILESADRELFIRKSAIVKDQSGQVAGVSFVIEATTSVGRVTVPSSKIVKPDVLAKP